MLKGPCLIYVICVCSCPTQIVLCFCFVFLRLVYLMLPVSLDCPFLIVPSIFSNTYFKLKYICQLYLSILYIFCILSTREHTTREHRSFSSVAFKSSGRGVHCARGTCMLTQPSISVNLIFFNFCLVFQIVMLGAVICH